MQLLPLLCATGTPLPPPTGPAALARVVDAGGRTYAIHLCSGGEPPVQALLQQRYAWRGYRLQPPRAPQHLTLAVRCGRATVGTLAVAFDAPAGLGADAAFAAELQALRARGRRLCEFTRLALACPAEHSNAVLAGLFHVAWIGARRLRAADTLLLEVHPRHERFYRACLGARRVGDARHQPRVQAPAVLLALDLAAVQRRLAERRGPLYAHAFSAEEERLVLARLLVQQRAAGLLMD